MEMKVKIIQVNGNSDWFVFALVGVNSKFSSTLELLGCSVNCTFCLVNNRVDSQFVNIAIDANG